MGLVSRAERSGKMPGPQSALVVSDRAMKAASRQLEAEVLPAVRAGAPKRTGRLAGSFRARRRLAHGVDLSIGPRSGGSRGDRSGAFYGPFVTGGTGLYGPSRRPIRRRDGLPFIFTAGDGEVIVTGEVRGQRPNPFVATVAAWADRRAVEISEAQLELAAQTITDRNL